MPPPPISAISTISRAKNRTVPLGLRRFLHARRPARPSPSYSPSTLHPHKTRMACSALAIFRRDHPDYRLIVTGIHGFFSQQLHDLRDSLRRGSVDSPAGSARGSLRSLPASRTARPHGSKASAPVLEALASGVPSACSAIEPLNSLAPMRPQVRSPRPPPSPTYARVRTWRWRSSRRRPRPGCPFHLAQNRRTDLNASAPGNRV
jgi:hypothetical protein